MGEGIAAQADPLPSWNKGVPKRNILTFVQSVTAEKGPSYVPPSERIAVFDNDGTLWWEQPLYFQLAFALDRVKALAPKHPEWQDHAAVQAVLENDMQALGAGREGTRRAGRGDACRHDHRRVRRHRQELAGDRAASAIQSAVHRHRLPSDGGIARLPARQRVQDLHRVGRRHRVHARHFRAGVRHSAGAGDRQQRKAEIRGPRRRAGTRRCPSSTSSTTKRASRSPSRSSSVGGRSLRSATRMAICRCCNGRPRGPVRRFMLLVDHTDGKREFDDRVSPMGRLDVGARRGPTAWLDGGQHERRLEAGLRVRMSWGMREFGF